MSRKKRIFLNTLFFTYNAALISLNFIRIFDNHYWADEGFSVLLSKMTVFDMFQATARDVHPPLYYIVIRIFFLIFGQQGWAYHLASLIPYVITMVFAMVIIRKRFGYPAALLLATLLSISTLAVTYNVEIRMYSLAAMFTLLSFYGYYKILKNERWGCTLFVVMSLGAAYSHYYAMMSVAILYLALLIEVILKKFPVKKLLIVYAVTVACYIPWLIQMVSTFIRTSKKFWLESIPGLLESVTTYFPAYSAKYSLGMLGLTIALVAFWTGCDLKRTRKISAESNLMIWGLVVSFGTFAMGEAISLLIRPAFLLRYLYPTLPIIWLVLCIAISQVKYEKMVACILILVVWLVSTGPYINTYKTDKEADRKTTETILTINENISPGEGIVSNSEILVWTILSTYFPDNPNMKKAEADFGIAKWLVFNRDLKEKDINWLSQNGFTAEEILCNGCLGNEDIHFYELVPYETR